MSRSVPNLVCMRHPHYKDTESPDLTCKVCCAKFVSRIRAQQEADFASINKTSGKLADDFMPFSSGAKTSESGKRHVNFDGSWI